MMRRFSLRTALSKSIQWTQASSHSLILIEQMMLHAHLFSEEHVDAGFEELGSTTPAWLIAIRLSPSTRTVSGISLK